MNNQEELDVKRLIDEINQFNSKKLTQISKDEQQLNQESAKFWIKLFNNYFLIECNSYNDDLLFFVRNYSKRNKFSSKHQATLEVFRKNFNKLPLGDLDINWEETLYINIIMQLYEYKLTFAICTRTSLKEFQILSKYCQQVYASPSYRSMSNKAEMEQLTYPDIFFTVDNYEELMCKVPVRNGEIVCVELAASDRNGNPPIVLFFGTVHYEKIQLTNESNFKVKRGTNFPQAQLIRMKGPRNKGISEMAIQKRTTDISETSSIVNYTIADGQTREREVDAESRRKKAVPILSCCFSSSSFSSSITQRDTYVPRRMSDPSSLLEKRIKNWREERSIKKSRSATQVCNVEEKVNEIEAVDFKDEIQNCGQGELWKLPGFNQAFHCWKANKRANSPSFDVFITYIALPFHCIIKDLLDSKRHPILTF